MAASKRYISGFDSGCQRLTSGRPPSAAASAIAAASISSASEALPNVKLLDVPLLQSETDWGRSSDHVKRSEPCSCREKWRAHHQKVTDEFAQFRVYPCTPTHEQTSTKTYERTMRVPMLDQRQQSQRFALRKTEMLTPDVRANANDSP